MSWLNKKNQTRSGMHCVTETREALSSLPPAKNRHITTILTKRVWGIALLQSRHSELDDVSNHRRLGCLLNRLFRHTSKKTSKLCVTGPCKGNSPVTSEFPSPRISTAEDVYTWWRHHAFWRPSGISCITCFKPSSCFLCASDRRIYQSDFYD